MTTTSVAILAISPDNGEARRWVTDELRKGAYNTDPSWFDRLQDTVGGWFARAFGNVFGSDSGPVPIAISIIIALLILAAAIYLVSRLRRNRKIDDVDSDSRTVLGKTRLTAAEYRELAGRYLDEGDYYRSVINSMRAIAQEASERTLLTRADSLTAHEVAFRLTGGFPSLRDELLSAANIFDDIAYGGRAATLESATTLQSLDVSLKRMKPKLGNDAHAPAPSLPPLRPVSP